jgi:hypothetical protein
VATSRTGVTISLGGEIGEVGGEELRPCHELHAYMNGYNQHAFRSATGARRI